MDKTIERIGTPYSEDVPITEGWSGFANLVLRILGRDQIMRTTCGVRFDPAIVVAPGVSRLVVQIEAPTKDADVLIPFSKGAVKEYLDTCIGFWRLKQDKGDEGALYYVDAYQSMRMSLFGGKKKEESNEDEAGSEIEYHEGDPRKPRQFYKVGQKYISDD